MKNKKIGFILISCAVFILSLSAAIAATNISPTSTEHWAWNDAMGWLDFYNTHSVTVQSSLIQGYASSSVGFISLDCSTSPAGNICGTSNYKVVNDGLGNLSGWGWNDAVGWISFCGSVSSPTADCPSSAYAYRVQIDPVSGDFSQWAWNDAVGWISFNCVDPGICGTSNYKVKTSWLATSTYGYVDSSVFDTGISGGAQINSVVWQGSMPSPADGSFVAFQFAVSGNPSGPWDYEGPDGTSSTYYTTNDANSPYVVDYTLHNNVRYFRYRMTLASNMMQTLSPRVDSVSVNWSR